MAPDIMFVWDIGAVAAAGYICALTYRYMAPFGSQNPDFLINATRISILGGLLAPLVMSQSVGRHAAGTPGRWAILAHTAQGVAVLVGLLLAVGFLTRILATVPRLWVVSWIIMAFCATVAGHLWFVRPVQAILRRHSAERIAIVGGGLVAEQLVRHVDGLPDSHVRVALMIDEVADGPSDPAFARLLDMGRKNLIDRVVLTLPASEEAQLSETVHRLKALDVEVIHCPAFFAGPGGQAAKVTQVAGAPAIVLTRPPIGHWGLVVKGLEDRLLAYAGIAFLAPVFVIIALMIRLESRGPIIFRQSRHGWNGSEFQVFKFRTMLWQPDRVAVNGEVQTRRGDQRITRIGAILRKTSLDELPQLFNVVNGTMSLVGPRPHPVVMRTEDRLCEEIIAEYPHRHRVKPGITGWAQINGYRGATETAEQVRKRVEHDIEYIENWSLLLDLKILALTPWKILFSCDNAF